MPAPVIRDIRYFESKSTGGWDGYVGTLFPFNSAFVAMGTRIAEKLREFKFTLGDFDHLYIVYTPKLANAEIQYETSEVEPWFRSVYYGAKPAPFRRMADTKKEQFAVDSTFAVLTSLCAGNDKMRRIAEDVRSLLARSGRDLEVIRKTKETASYKVIITFQVVAHPGPSIAWIEFADKKTGAHGKKPFLKLKHPEDIYFLVSDVTVKKDKIVIKPRPSFRAKLYAKDYRVPIKVPIAEVIAHPVIGEEGHGREIARYAK